MKGKPTENPDLSRHKSLLVALTLVLLFLGHSFLVGLATSSQDLG